MSGLERGLTRKYVYDEMFDSTVAELTDDYRFLGVQPHGSAKFMLLFCTKDADGVSTGRCNFVLTADELEEWIADLQRARMGCFHGRWPRPDLREAEETHEYGGTVRDLVNWLEETYSANDVVDGIAFNIIPVNA